MPIGYSLSPLRNSYSQLTQSQAAATKEAIPEGDKFCSINEFNVNHYPTLEQQEQGERIVKGIFNAPDKAARQPFLAEINNLISNLCQERINLDKKGKESSALCQSKTGYSSVDNDNYIRNVTHVYTICKELDVGRIQSQDACGSEDLPYHGAFSVSHDEALVDNINKDINQIGNLINKNNIELPFLNKEITTSHTESLNDQPRKIENLKIDATVTRLDDIPLPTEAQLTRIDETVELLRNLRGEEARKPVRDEIIRSKEALSHLRNEIFEVLNEDTDDVFGKLREGRTRADRNDYIQKLQCYELLRTNIEKMQDEHELRANEVNSVFDEHHSTALYGDLKQLRLAKEGKEFTLPDLTYNRGSRQFG